MRLICSRIALLILVLSVSACSEVRIELPTAEFVDEEKPDSFQVSFTNGKPADLALQLNAADVTDMFITTEDGTSASATGVDLAEYIFPGKNIFKASAGGLSSQVAFYYDTEGPVIHILNTNRDSGIVSGYVADDSAVASLTLDGAAVSLDENNHFSTSFSDLPFNEFTAVDAYAQVSSTQYARKDQEFIPGMSARLNEGGLAFLADALALQLGNIDFDAFTEEQNPLIGFSILGLFGADLSLKNFAFGEPEIALEVLDNGRMATVVDVPNFSIGVEVTGNAVFIPFSLGGTLILDNVHFSSDLVLDIVNKDLDVEMARTKVRLDGFQLDFDRIPNILGIETIIGHIFGGLSNFMSPFFVGIFEGNILPVVSEFIGEMAINVSVTTTEDETLDVSVVPTFLDTFDNGLTIDLGATVVAPTPSQAATPLLGSLYRAGEMPRIGNTTPDGADFDIGVAISANMMNQALFAAHEAGITTIELRPDNMPGADPAGVSVIQSDQDDVQTTDLIGLSLLPASAPFIKLTKAGSASGVIGWHDVTLEFDMKRVGWSDYQNIFSVTFNLEAAYELGATDDGFLQIGVEQLPTIEVLASSNTGLIQLTPTFMNNVVAYFMPVVMPTVVANMKAIPLPRIAGYSIHPKDFWITGSTSNNLVMAGNLIKVSTTNADSAPNTILAFAGTSTMEEVSSAAAISAELSINNGEVTIGILNVGANNQQLEQRFRVDGGKWSVWKPRSELTLRRLLGGSHDVQVCSRTAVLKQEQECPTVSFETTVEEQPVAEDQVEEI